MKILVLNVLWLIDTEGGGGGGPAAPADTWTVRTPDYGETLFVSF